jgi:hypothetical protein
MLKYGQASADQGTEYYEERFRTNNKSHYSGNGRQNLDFSFQRLRNESSFWRGSRIFSPSTGRRRYFFALRPLCMNEGMGHAVDLV